MGVLIEEDRSVVWKALSNNVTYILLGVLSFVFFWFSFRLNTFPLSSLLQHVVLCCLGYQVFMAVGFLSLTPGNGWTAPLKLLHQRRIHWILQLIGFILALAGSVIMGLAKAQNFDSYHSITALIALVFAGVSCINGLTSHYAKEWSRILPPSVSKISHILFGIIAFVMANVSLCFGWDTRAFRNWASEEVVIAMMVITAVFTLLVILPSCSTLWRKLQSSCRN